MYRTNNENQIPTIKARILMDTGSFRTYVTDEIAKQLQLNPSTRESYAVFPFGSGKPNQINTPKRNLPITASVAPNISGGILRSPLDKTSIKKLEGCKLTDTPLLQDE